MVYIIESMKLEDISEVVEIEKAAFSTSWPAQAYRREITENRLARYIVARWTDGQTLNTKSVGYMPNQDQSNKKGFLSSIKRTFTELFAPEPELYSKEPLGNLHLGGYAGIWLMLDESHITTIAVRPNIQHHGLGELLMIALSDLSIAIGADRMTLEVRVTNTQAQDLYHKFGFREEGVRRRYYSDNNEDALIMWSEQLKSPEFEARLAKIRQETQDRFLSHPLPPPNWSSNIEA